MATFQCRVGALFVVDSDPSVSYFPDLIQVCKEVRIKHSMPIRSAKALDKSVLAWFAGLDLSQLDAYSANAALRSSGSPSTRTARGKP